MKENNSEPLKIKIFTVGNSTVGKTCFIRKFDHNTFMNNYISTIGFDHSVKKNNITFWQKC